MSDFLQHLEVSVIEDELEDGYVFSEDTSSSRFVGPELKVGDIINCKIDGDLVKAMVVDVLSSDELG